MISSRTFRTRSRLLGSLLAALAVVALASCSKDDDDDSRPRDVTGIVTQPGGTPAGGALVVLHPRAPIATTPYRSTYAELDGSFRIGNVTPGIYIVSAYDLSVIDDLDLVAGTSVNVPPGTDGGETTFVTLALDSAGTFTGTVLLEDQILFHDIQVRVQGLLGGDVTDTTGRYVATGVPPGVWTVVASRSGYLPQGATDTIPTPGDTSEVTPILLPRE
jgi:hypothetical protein